MPESPKGASWLHETFPDIYTVLRDVLTEKGISQWLRAKHRLLDGQIALEVLQSGDIEKVKETAMAYAEGVYV